MNEWYCTLCVLLLCIFYFYCLLYHIIHISYLTFLISLYYLCCRLGCWWLRRCVNVSIEQHLLWIYCCWRKNFYLIIFCLWSEQNTGGNPASSNHWITASTGNKWTVRRWGRGVEPRIDAICNTGLINNSGNMCRNRVIVNNLNNNSRYRHLAPCIPYLPLRCMYSRYEIYIL